MNDRRRLRELYSDATDGEYRGCARKIRHPSRKIAVAVARSAERAFGGQFNAYRCRLCRKWHIGHDRCSHLRPPPAEATTMLDPRKERVE